MLFSVLINNLCVPVKPMYQLYCLLKDHDEPPTPEAIDIASGKKQLDGHTEVECLKKLEKASENIKKAFEDQQAQAAINDPLLSMCASHSLINSAHGTRRSLSNILQNGLSHAINPSMRLKNLSLSRWWTTHTKVAALWKFCNATRSSSVWWKWVRIQLKEFVRCSWYVILFSIPLFNFI